MKKIIFGLIITSMIILAGCSSQTPEENTNLEVNQEIEIDNNQIEQNQEELDTLLTEGLLIDDDSQEIGSLI